MLRPAPVWTGKRTRRLICFVSIGSDATCSFPDILFSWSDILTMRWDSRVCMCLWSTYHEHTYMITTCANRIRINTCTDTEEFLCDTVDFLRISCIPMYIYDYRVHVRMGYIHKISYSSQVFFIVHRLVEVAFSCVTTSSYNRSSSRKTKQNDLRYSS